MAKIQYEEKIKRMLRLWLTDKPCQKPQKCKHNDSWKLNTLSKSVGWVGEWRGGVGGWRGVG